MSTDPLGTLPMFPEPDPPPIAKPPVKPFNDVSDGYGRVSYAKYRPKKPVRCDDCAAAFIDDPNAPHSLPAAVKRTQAGAKPLLLCHRHAQARKEAEAS
jgi:hypothetical protein